MTATEVMFDHAQWPAVVERLRAIIGAYDSRDEAREAVLWRQVLAGRPVYAWVAIQAFARPGTLDALAAGFTLTGQDTEAILARDPHALFEQAPEPKAIEGVPGFAPDLWRQRAGTGPAQCHDGHLPVVVETEDGIEVRIHPGVLDAPLFPGFDPASGLQSTEERAAILCTVHPGVMLAECGCPSMAEILGESLPDSATLPDPPPVPCPEWGYGLGVFEGEEFRDGYVPPRDDTRYRWCVHSKGHDGPHEFKP